MQTNMDGERQRLHLRHFIPARICRVPELNITNRLISLNRSDRDASAGAPLHPPELRCGWIPAVCLVHNSSSPHRHQLRFAHHAFHSDTRLKELIEEHYGCEYDLFVEFTGIISWKKGAKIGWHSDNDRPYLQQRHFTAVCYLNTYADDFQGGLFHFKEGTPSTIIPEIGIEDGERCTLALWFTLDSSFDEDTKLLNSITESGPLLQDVGPHPNDALGIPVAASSSMYLVTLGHQESDMFTDISLDIRVASVIEAGFEIFVTLKNTFVPLKDIGNQLTSECFRDLQDALDKPVKIKLDGNDTLYVCKNAIHALQVLHFCKWRSHEMKLLHEGGVCRSDEFMIDEEPKFESYGASNSAPCNEILWKVHEWNQYLKACWGNLQRCYPAWKQQRCICWIVS